MHSFVIHIYDWFTEADLKNYQERARTKLQHFNNKYQWPNYQELKSCLSELKPWAAPVLWNCYGVITPIDQSSGYLLTRVQIHSSGEMLVVRNSNLLNSFLYIYSKLQWEKEKLIILTYEHYYNNWCSMLNWDRKSHRSMQKNVFEDSVWWDFLSVW